MNKDKELLYALVKAFIEKEQITCPDTIYQRDSLVIKASEFMEACCNVVGYIEMED